MLLATTLLLTIFTAILVPVYWKHYGPQNFLWLSDVCLFLTLFALWFHSPLLISMTAIGILPLEILWNIDFFAELFTGHNLVGISHYMFEDKYTNLLKGLSLFHVFIPVICFWLLAIWGYDKNALPYQITLNTLILIATYLFTAPKENTNWVFMPTIKNWQRIQPMAWLLFLLVAFPVLMIFPMHLLLSTCFTF
ncbi:MAG TPA: hypothetical protein VJN02_00040 [Gammaproteobacteria bacterium]|nr:hypothetical protein [Gammaproteobacteria bacterium]